MSKDKNVLVTGASSGIGYHLAKCFAKNGYNLVVISRDQDEINQVANDLSSEFSITATPIAADLFNKDSAKDIYKQVKDKNIQIDILVNDAGQGQWGKFWEKSDSRDTNIGMSDKATPESVAQAGYEALMKGDDKVIPGFMNNVQAMANNVTPDQNSAEAFRATMAKAGK